MLGMFVALVVVAIVVYTTGEALPGELGFLIACIVTGGTYAAQSIGNQPARSGRRPRRRRRSKRVNDQPTTRD